jgi:hypothetical protein
VDLPWDLDVVGLGSRLSVGRLVGRLSQRCGSEGVYLQELGP